DGRGGAGDDEETESSKKAFGIRESAFAKLDTRYYEPEIDTRLRKSAMIVFPIIMVFGIYVILNGHLSPGGGFSDGAILSTALILCANAYGFERVHEFFNERTFITSSSTALMIYALSKGYSFFTGANDIHSIIPKGTIGNILSGGLILPLNICVGLIVAGTLYGFYALFSEGEI
ncbi:MAG: MnhB domain-containing protein, partial [Synergistaceae bacterium]|nr:MnhB domain-containing protein [Synergistaceae bacterium]